MVSTSYASCPTAAVEAPIEIVWTLLTRPTGWGDFFDLRINRVQPPGSATVGQRVSAETGPRFLHLEVEVAFTLVDPAQHRLGMDIRLPFGLSVREDLDCIAVEANRCRVNYRCNFGFPGGWRGGALRTLLGRRLDSGPRDSLMRLKRVAEQRVRVRQDQSG